MIGISVSNVGVTLRKGGGFAYNTAKDFQERVIAAGGTFEALSCLTGTISNLSNLHQPATTFNLRVVAAGGTFEAINCLQTTIDDLKSITI